MAKLKVTELSETIAGLIIQGKLTAASVRPTALAEPYPALVKLYMKKKGTPETNDIIEAIGPGAYDAAVSAADRSKNLPAKWPSLLETAASRRETGLMFQKYAQRLMDGEEVDLAPIQSSIARLDRNITQLSPLSSIKAQTNPFILTGYQPIDEHLNGIPEAGLTVAAGRPGVGKTWLMLKIAACFAKKHKKDVGIFSLEMTSQQFMFRAKDLMDLPKAILDRVLICDDVLGVSEISALAARAEGLGLICVDFAELLLEGDSQQTEQTMAYVYRTLAWTAKRLGIPVLLLSQLNRSNSGDLPNLNRLRYTGMAEALAAMVLFLHNPNAIYDAQGEDQPVILAPGDAGIVAAKSRFGFKWGGPGVIHVPWTGSTGWGDTATNWTGLGG